MTTKKRFWKELYDILDGSELTNETELLKIEVIHLMTQSMGDVSRAEIGLVLFVIGDSILSESADANG